MEEVIKGMTEVLNGITAGQTFGITVIVDGNSPVNKKCYKWVDGMMIQIRCDSPDVEGTIEY